jgi:hypothetical protein
MMYQMNPIENRVYDHIRYETLPGYRQSIQQAEVSQAPSRFVSPSKPPGQRTARQIEMNGDVTHAAQIVARNGKDAVQKRFPPPPSSKEMVSMVESWRATARAIYERHPVKPLPFGPRMDDAYAQSQADDGLYTVQVKMSDIYA